MSNSFTFARGFDSTIRPMAALENYINNLAVIFKRLFKKYKLLHTCRVLPLIHISSRRETNSYNSFLSTKGFYPYYYNNKNSSNNFSYYYLNRYLPHNEDWNKCARKNFISFSAPNKRKEFIGRKLVGFSMEQMYDVVSDVNKYKDFLPFCKKSEVKLHENNYMKAEMVIGFPPVVEKYTSDIKYTRPTFITAESKDAVLFNHLVTSWRFSPGLSKNPNSCVINFYVSFEFKSIFHSQLANMFFNELVKQMESAFYKEAIRRYGKATIPTIKLKVLNNNNNNDSSSSSTSSSSSSKPKT